MHVLISVRQQFRSWMFIYAGLVAAIILSIEPTREQSGQTLEGGEIPAAANAPLLRRDI